MDVPYFLAPCDSADLPLEGGGRVDGYFQAPSLAQVISRIGSMDDADLELQTMIIRGTFAARAARPVQGTRPTVPENGDASARAPLSRNELVNEARAIAEQVCASALRAPDGALHWLGLREIEGASRYRLTPLDDSLYDGNCGIALFLATVAHIEKTSEFRDQALAAIARVRSCLNGPGAAQALVRRGAIGGGLGLGSIIYALARIGNLLGEESVLSDVQRAAEMLTDERIAEDCYFDVMAGAAGAILGLLAAERVIGTGTALERAVACGRSLLDRRMAVNGSGRAWQSPAGVPLTGLSHGAAGIAYALLRLYEVTRADEFLQAAEEGIGYERSVFDAASGNWPDLRDQSADGGAPRFAFGWCHGAPGIGLARLGSLGVFDDEAVRAEVDAALRTTIACGAEGVDHLCCGTMGRFETLAVAAAELERDDLRILAETNAAAVVQRARETGAYRLPGLAGEAISPSLFCGLSGIGYQLLRLGYPDQIPSVLLWK
jgi:type 2 lantibiotic biosynthesis protein LanM